MFKIVIDSTSSTPVAELEEMGVAVVPLTIRIGEESFIDGVNLSNKDFYEKMAAHYSEGLPKTSCPAPGEFEQAYRMAADAGADGALCLCLSAGLSGTYNSAYVAGQNVDFPVEVIDSKACVQVLSMMAEKAAAMRDEGATLEEAATHMRAMVKETETYFPLETLDNLVRGGMIGKAAGLAGSALKLKPILNISKDTGEASPAGKARGNKELVKNTVALVKTFIAEHGESEIRFSHANALDRVARIQAALDTEGIAYNADKVGWIGSVIGTNSGEKAVGVSLCPKRLL